MSGLRERMNRLRGVKEAQPGDEAVKAAANDSHAAGHEAEPADGQQISAESPVTDGADIRHCSEQDAGPEWSALGVRLLLNGDGECLERRQRLPLSHRSGHHRLEEWLPHAEQLGAIHADSGVVPGTADVLFLDLETTGLGGGTGNVPFMTGIAYYEDGEFVIRQFLIRHPAEERAMLSELAGLLPRFRWLATYNGRSFDWPLVQTRLIMNGLGKQLPELLHLDFLHPSRSIWKNTLASCRLSHVEEERLGIFRKDDVPGSLAPTLYFRYLAEGDPALLEGVFRHNEQDMITLACLGIRFAQLLSGRAGTGFPMPEEGEELLRTGLWLERMGEREEAERFYGILALEDAASPSALHGLAMRDKKAGNWERAVVLWQKAAAGFAAAAIPDWQAHVELAMYFEHKGKDPASAIALAEEALELALLHPLARRSAKMKGELEALRRRRDRLLRKLGAAAGRLEAGG